MLVNNLAKLNRSSRNAAAGSLVLIAGLAMYNWIVAPHAAYLSAAQRHESSVVTIAKKNEHISRIVQIKREKLKKLREQSSQLMSTLFTAEKSKEFFEDLEAISEQAGCSVYSLNFINKAPDPYSVQPEEAAGMVDKIAVLSIIGGYENVIKLLERLQMRSEKVWIDSLRMQTLERHSAHPRCDITLRIHVIQDKESAL
ncbi:MAG TPA: hypothetical protein VMX13_08850 [Sedimentisphaerales bacterium]|nr:hypothetical protein [Sedimentisphaerales bacterium]